MELHIKLKHRIHHVAMSLCNLGFGKEKSKQPRTRAPQWSFFVAVVVAVAASRSIAQPLQLAQLDHTSWTSRDGAPLRIHNMEQDRDGSLWLTADNGLYNFNGITFTLFQLPNSQIPFSIHVDRSGALWAGFSIKGILQIRDHKIVRSYDERDGLPGGSVKQIAQAPDGTIIAIARGHLVELRGRRWEETAAAAAVLGPEVQRLFFDRKGTLWVADNAYVWKRPARKRDFQKVCEAGGLNTLFAEGPDGRIWIQTIPLKIGPSLTFQLSPDDKPPPPSERIQSNSLGIYFVGDGLLWMGTPSQGVFRVDPTQFLNKKSRRQDVAGGGVSSERFGRLDGLTSNVVDDMIQDLAGDTWVATEAGLDRFRQPNLVRFVDSPAEWPVVLTHCPRGDLWMGSSLSPAISIQKAVVVNHGQKREFVSAHCDAMGVVWMSTLQGLWRYSGNQSRYIAPPPGISVGWIRQLVGDNDHLLFASITRNGLWRYSDGTWSRVETSGFPDTTPFSLYMDSRMRLWTGYIDNRIAMLEGGAARIFPGDTERPLGMVQVFLESRFGLFVGGSNGIAVLEGDHLHTLQTVDQVAVRGISGLLQSPNGDLWLNGLHGIVRIPVGEVTQALRSPNYQMRSELFSEAGIGGPSPQVLELPSAVEDSDGIFWFATSNTVVSVDPKALRQSTNPPILADMSMTVDGQPFANNGRINPGYHTLRLKYFGTCITAPQKVTYRYKLDGADTSWQDVGNRSEAVYTGLRPGTYHFSVTASNGEGAWSQPDDSLQFTVLPSLYQRPAFLVLCAAALIALLLMAFRWRVRRVAFAIRASEQVRADERIRIARDLHDTLLQGMQGLMLRFTVAAKQLPLGTQSRESLEGALLSADRLLAEGRNRVSRLRTSELTSDSLISGFKALAAELNYDKGVQFDLSCEGQLSEVNPVVLGELYYIGCEAISNAFRHSRASEIRVRLLCLPKAVVLGVSDNGVGFDWEAYKLNPVSEHWGVHGMQERAELIHATVEFSGSPNIGTGIEITVPARRAYKT